jgi:hypothetical protein
MAVIEQGKNTSFQWDKDNMRVINRLGLNDSSPSSVINSGIEALGDKKRLRNKYNDFENGDINLGALLKEIKEF